MSSARLATDSVRDPVGLMLEAAGVSPDEPALVAADTTLTWAQVLERIGRAANAIASLGVEPGRRIAVVGDNDPETLLFYAAAVLTGTGTIALNTHSAVPEVSYVLKDGDADVLWARGSGADVAIAAAEATGTTLILSDASGGGWERLMDSAVPAVLSASAPATTRLAYTSGTTGLPKGVELPIRAPADVGDHLEQLRRHPAHGLGPHLAVGPLYHFGPHAAVGLLLTGNQVVLIDRFDAAGVLRAVQEHAIASTVMVPTHFIRLLGLDEELRREFDLGSLRMVRQTGASCPVEIKRAMIDWLGPVIVETYGGTESGPVTSIESPDWLSHLGSVGQTIAGFEAVVVDDEGREVPPREIGRLFFRDLSGRGIVYYKDQVKTAEAHLLPGLFTLGDIGFVDDDGWVFISDRRSDLVVSGGVNLYPAQAERALEQHPLVVESACFGVEDSDLGHRLVGVVVLRSAVTGEELLRHCRTELGGQKSPKELRVVESIPRNAMGKVDKRALATDYLVAAFHSGACP